MAGCSRWISTRLKLGTLKDDHLAWSVRAPPQWTHGTDSSCSVYSSGSNWILAKNVNMLFRFKLDIFQQRNLYIICSGPNWISTDYGFRAKNKRGRSVVLATWVSLWFSRVVVIPVIPGRRHWPLWLIGRTTAVSFPTSWKKSSGTSLERLSSKIVPIVLVITTFGAARQFDPALHLWKRSFLITNWIA